MDVGLLPLQCVRVLLRTKPSTQSLHDYILRLRADYVKERGQVRRLDAIAISPESINVKLTKLHFVLQNLVNSPLTTPSQLLYSLAQSCKANADAIAFFLVDNSTKPAASALVHQNVQLSFLNLARACHLIGLVTSHDNPVESACLRIAHTHAFSVFKSLLSALTTTSSRLALQQNAISLQEQNPRPLALLTTLLQTLLASFYHAFFNNTSHSKHTATSTVHYSLHLSMQHHLLTRAADLLRLTVLDDANTPTLADTHGTNMIDANPSDDRAATAAAAMEARLLMPMIRTVMADALHLYPSSSSSSSSAPGSTASATTAKATTTSTATTHSKTTATANHCNSHSPSPNPNTTRAALTRTLLQRLYGPEAFAHLGPGVEVPPVVNEEDAERSMDVVMEGLRLEKELDGEGCWFAGEVAGCLGEEFVGEALWGGGGEGGGGGNGGNGEMGMED